MRKVKGGTWLSWFVFWLTLPIVVILFPIPEIRKADKVIGTFQFCAIVYACITYYVFRSYNTVPIFLGLAVAALAVRAGIVTCMAIFCKITHPFIEGEKQ